jgi:hypothetical protein
VNLLRIRVLHWIRLAAIAAAQSLALRSVAWGDGGEHGFRDGLPGWPAGWMIKTASLAAASTSTTPNAQVFENHDFARFEKKQYPIPNWASLAQSEPKPCGQLRRLSRLRDSRVFSRCKLIYPFRKEFSHGSA